MAHILEEEKTRLISGEDFGSESDQSLFDREPGGRLRRGTIFFTKYLYPIVFHTTLVLLYTAIFWASYANYGRSSCGLSNSQVYTPAREAVRFKKQRFDAELVIESDYIGEPTNSTDLAWATLIENMNIAVHASDLEKLDTKSIPIPGSPGMYIAGLSVYHELHCLKRLRQHVWKSHYFPNQTAEEERLNLLHTDHCIDVLRQAILCHADTALFTLQWPRDSSMPRADFSHEHQCVDWDVLNAWAAKRSVREDIMKNLKHPTRGKDTSAG